ncbi:DUF4253 domain-containing protein [Chitinophaga niabensis]|uniref:DUF4253 domain-containing protein n=1 Tax=Chitinophaga niabensis TaxID=536979 RepID=A0A1N6K1Y4_9BACT|nr:DUF4253 domain-containing protein [Chitinophaga niabensis]SIO50570.1 protein of unknown function [Chitinophaga niabensis]
MNTFESFIIDELKKISSGEFATLAPNLEMSDAKREDLPPALQADGLQFEYAGKDAKEGVYSLKDKLREHGYFIFVCEANFGHSPDKIGVIKSNDQFDILRFMATDGINYDIENADVIEKLQQWHSKYPFEIVGAAQDWVEAKFVGALPDFNAFAQDVYDFCPDIVDQGTETVEALGDEMKNSAALYLWWD